ncbi:MAG: 5'-methylthioadenosine/S-adenosylhomocysteine nucleosidase [Hyphomicrobiales bacterium]
MKDKFFKHGSLSSLVLMAAPAEYGAELQKLITPVFIGVGPVEAAVNSANVFAKLAAENSLPDLIISLGTAGSASLKQTEVYQVRSVSYRDMDASPLGFKKGVTPFVDHAVDIPLQPHIKGVPEARLSTGGSVISGKAYEVIDADMVDMETFAIMRACQMHNLKLLGLRGISDGKEELQQYDDWTRYLSELDVKLAAILENLHHTLQMK